ncbi:MutS2 family protein [Thermaerobacter marianensis DSM 12885]|uniref:Endonuclease MutS2 n=1 Tax=Thermaerobacter marianensis (strain ATCC 700841 / DSM 12885 / JCM 10246 / 7p75a) TaxID=644966 RepID=E6SIV9_THEM7|nr:endonuclease MutS2 [Thermaerobacter marianensis]ADU50954.1 MutS2 family protein [Thermaerobacter marianensis DSM 12885]
MDPRSLDRLEYTKILELLADQASFSLGAERCRSLEPLTVPDAVRERQAETEEAARLLEREGEIPLAGLADIRRPLQRAAKGGILSPEELLAVAGTARGARRLRAFLLNREHAYPRLAARAARLVPQPALEEAVAAAIGDDGRVRDEASPRLASLRRRLADLEEAIRRRLEEMIRSPHWAGALQEPLVTQRRGRFVLPVKAEARAQVPGVVHDQSASGATLFIEPMAVVELGNRLREAEAEEQEEVERILGELTRMVAAAGEELAATLEELADLDAIVARGRLALAMRAERPETLDRPRVDLKRARHPLLGPGAVPIDVWLGEGAGFDALVITGPNTGGKTVTLKTVGLLALMHQAGLHVPAAPGSALGVFPQIFCDVGDEQSIEQSLSTFSSHMSAIVGFARAARPGALVLLDEIGAGTDPDEGAALAIALLEHFRRRGCLVVATTHYSALKAYAYQQPGVENASVEFDAETLRPTYRLWIGLPGKSMALAIAQRLGLPEPILQRAREVMGAGAHRVEELIAAMEADRRAIATLRAEAEARRREAEALRQQRLRELEEQRQEHRARLEALEKEMAFALQEARRQTEGLVGRLRAAMGRLEAALDELARVREALLAGRGAGAGTEGGAADRIGAPGGDDLEAVAAQALEAAQAALEQTRDTLGALEGRTEAVRQRAREARRQARAGAEAALAAGLRPGARVEVLSLRQQGEVLEVPDDPGEPVTVQAGILRMRVPRTDLRLLDEPAAAAAPPGAAAAGSGGADGTRTGPAGPGRPRGRGPEGRNGSGEALERARLMQAKAREFDPEIHLRQLTVDEALARLDKYLDDAILAGAPQVRIIHGKGTGTLRRAVHEFLRRHPAVASYRLGAPNEGGAGATVAVLKDSGL